MDIYCVRIKGDVLVTVPRQIDRITTWVLLEQEDWFEKEIDFVRNLLKPGMRALDIGANVGVYALTMAKAVARGGTVWAFEPASEPEALLRHSIEQNRFANLVLTKMALSDREGSAVLQLSSHDEFNSLVHTHGAGNRGTETVEISTLDRQQAIHAWGDLDFVKIDAEGAELNILAGGKQFFDQQSPLVMFEADDSQPGTDKRALPAAFRELGFEIYRLIGPASMLVPFGSEDELRPFEINLFACKRDRAERLAAAGLLASAVEDVPAFPEGGGQILYRAQAYAAIFGKFVSRTPLYERALDAYAVWHDTNAAPNLRYAALRAAFAAAKEAAKEAQTIARLVTLARLAYEMGDRAFAAETLSRTITLLSNGAAPPDEPFFPPARRYEAIEPLDPARHWFMAASVEAWEMWRHFSGYYLPVQTQRLNMLDWLQSTPFASAAIERRRQLQSIRAGRQAGMTSTSFVAKVSPDHLNPGLWTTGGTG